MADEIENNTSNRTWLIVGGIGLLILGLIAFNSSLITSFAVVYTLAWVLILGGIAGFALSFTLRDGGSIVLALLSSVLAFIVGILVLSNPSISLVSLSVLLSLYFLADGVVSIISSFFVAGNRIWSFLYGIVLLVLGGAVWAHLPQVSLYIFGIFIGIALFVKGIVMIAEGITNPQRRVATRQI